MQRRRDDNPDLTESSPSTVEIRLLGGFSTTIDHGRPSAQPWNRRHAAALVKVLALTPGHRLHRERVMDLLWPELPLGVAAPRLHKAAHFARRLTGRDNAIVMRDEVVSLFPSAEVTVDVVEFERLAQQANASADRELADAALAWWGGELLPDDAYEEWAVDRRELLHLRHLDMLRIAGRWRDLAAADPTNDEAHRALVQDALARGDAPAVLSELRHVDQVYARHLDHEATPHGSTSRVQALRAELADLLRRQQAVLTELAASVLHDEPVASRGEVG